MFQDHFDNKLKLMKLMGLDFLGKKNNKNDTCIYGKCFFLDNVMHRFTGLTVQNYWCCLHLKRKMRGIN